MEINRMKISVIVPIYNSEIYLTECLNSLSNQDVQDMEIILVNDGSTDASEEICLEFAGADKRFKYYSKKNGGSVSARNLGIEKSCGEYLAFVDSDDYIDKGYLSSLLKEAIDNNADIVARSYMVESKSGSKIQNCMADSGIYYEDKKMELLNGIIATDIQGTKLVNSALWGKLFKADLIKSEYKRVSSIIREGEDLILFVATCCTAKRISILNESQSFYHYVIHENQVTKRYDSDYEKRIPVLYNSVLELEHDFLIPDFQVQFEKLVLFYTCKGFENVYYRQSTIGFAERQKCIKYLCAMANYYTHIIYERTEKINFILKRILIKHNLSLLIEVLYKNILKHRYC